MKALLRLTFLLALCFPVSAQQLGPIPPTDVAVGCAQLPALTGAVTNAAGSCATAITGVITAGGPVGSATVAPIITYNVAGQLTTVSSATIAPAIGSVTGLGTGVATALGDNVNATGGFPTVPVALTALATQATNTVLVNAASGTAAPIAQSVSGCSAAGDALIWTTNTGFGCNTSITAAAVPASALTAGAGITITGTTPATIAQTGGYASGFVNKFRNGTFDVWQRGTASYTIGTTGNYGGADGWKVYFTGSSSVATARGSGTGGSLYSIAVYGAAGNTDIQIGQRIESYIAAPLAGNTVTVQFNYIQTTGSSQTPKISSCYASATDNFGTCTGDLSSSNSGWSSCATSTWCKYSWTFTASANASQGYEIDFDCNAAFGSGTLCGFTASDIRVTPGVSTGANSTPPPPELRPIGVELPFNQRYLYLVQGAPTYGVPAFVASATVARASFQFPGTMRAAPTLSVGAIGNVNINAFTPGNLTATSYSLDNAGLTNAVVDITASAGGMTGGQGASVGVPTGASALFSAEL